MQKYLNSKRKNYQKNYIVSNSWKRKKKNKPTDKKKHREQLYKRKRRLKIKKSNKK